MNAFIGLCGYERLIRTIDEEGIRFCGFNDYSEAATKRKCILRHDVDYDLKHACEFAKYEADIECSQRITSTYFVLLSSDFYNLHSKESKKYLQQILDQGHSIGLHFDQTLYETYDAEELVGHIKYEISILEDILGCYVNCFSYHRPTRNILEQQIEIDKIINTYSTLFFTQFKYLSDSRMNWRENPCDSIRDKRVTSIQLLTHPFWYRNTNNDLKDIIRSYVCSANIERYNKLSDNFRDLSDVLRIEEIK